MEGLKFSKVQDLVLYNLARARKESTISDIRELTGNILDEKQIFNAIDHLLRRKLVFRIKKGKKVFILLNINQFNIKRWDPDIEEFIFVNRIKKILGEHWEDYWEEEWKNAVKG